MTAILPPIEVFNIIKCKLCDLRKVLMNGISIMICNGEYIELLLIPPAFQSNLFALERTDSMFEHHRIQERIIEEHGERNIPLCKDTWNRLCSNKRRRCSLNHQARWADEFTNFKTWDFREFVAYFKHMSIVVDQQQLNIHPRFENVT